MTVKFSHSSDSRLLRRSLKRGYARQVISTARRSQAEHHGIFAELYSMSPNRRGKERTVRRLRKAPGVVSAGIATDRVVVVLRNACAMVTRSEGVDVFTEDAVIYTRVTVLPEKQKVITWINRANFSLHALERFIERSGCALGPGVVDAIDAEAETLLRSVIQGRLLEQDGDEYLRARETGVWAGSQDVTSADQGWRFEQEEALIPTFSARTFLSPDEMKPEVWLRWQDNPRLSMVA